MIMLTYTSTNEWHHVCVTVDRDGNMLYINGLELINCRYIKWFIWKFKSF